MYTVDRIENNIAILEDDNRNMIEVSINQLPKNVKEGDKLNRKYEIIDNESEKDEIDKKFKSLFK